MIVQPDAVCPCCASGDLRLAGKLPDSYWFAGKELEHALPGGNLYRCRNCQLKFRYPLHDAGTYKLLYDNATVATWAAEAERRDWDLIIDYIHKQLPQGGRVLDFGCYSGGLLARLGTDFECFGVEINRAAAAVASAKAQGFIWPTVDDIPKNLNFDVVIASDVLEHMPNPMDAIESLSTWLSDQGTLIITTGDADNRLWNRFGANWWYCFYPEHISFLSRAWLEFLSRESNLLILRCETFRYFEGGVAKRLIDTTLAYCYGWFPATYLLIGRLLKRLHDHPDLTSVPGNGVSADHLFIVLTRKPNNEGQ